MTLKFELTTGSSANLDRDALTRTVKARVKGDLPYTGPRDCFDYISDYVMGQVVANHATQYTRFGTLFWNSIQLSEVYYAQLYDVTINYSTIDKQSGTYQINWDQAVGNVHVTAGRRIAGYPTATCPNSGGVFWNGEEVTGTEVPVPNDSFSVMYRHPKAFLNFPYILATGDLVGYPNADVFLGFPIGTVRFMGGPRSQTESEASATYNFEFSPNVTNLVVGGITISEKSGFDVLSPIYEPSTSTVGAGTHAVKTVKGIEVIRCREFKSYRSVFGWG